LLSCSSVVIDRCVPGELQIFRVWGSPAGRWNHCGFIKRAIGAARRKVLACRLPGDMSGALARTSAHCPWTVQSRTSRHRSLPAQRYRCRHRGRRNLACHASWDWLDSAEDFLEVATVTSSCLAIVTTAALAVRGPPPNATRQRQIAEEEGSAYAVMGFVSCIPLFSWTAWVLPALTQPERSPLYYAYAALYACPLLLHGFDMEGYTLLLTALGAAHVQVHAVITLGGCNLPAASALHRTDDGGC
jgi:hypothetical protein